MAGLTPPPPFLPAPGAPATRWDEWFKAFEFFVVASSDKTPTDARKVALLQHCLGLEGQRQYEAIKDTPAAGAADNATEYDKMCRRLAARFTVRQGLVSARDEFHQRRQRPGESIDDFVGALRRLAVHCSFDKYSSDEAVKTQIVAGTSVAPIRDRLLMEDDDQTAEQVVRRGEFHTIPILRACSASSLKRAVFILVRKFPQELHQEDDLTMKTPFCKTYKKTPAQVYDRLPLVLGLVNQQSTGC